ncbi:MAG: hypothetical protein Q7T74_02040, partial [Candidatus Saccharibacteria bacterium]|nr:hypothetical protein [Candidatus Saccharibacteria bacterium]
MIWREFDGLFEMGDPESVVELALPYPAVESLANLFLALQYAPRSVKGDNLATLPLAQITSTSETGLSIRILDYPDKKHSDFEFAIINDPSSNLGISIRADKRVPPMMKAAVLALEHLPIPSKWRPKLEIDHSQVVITGLGMRTNLYEPSSTGVSQITYELIKSQADKLTKLFVKKRPGFRIDFIAQPHSTEKIIFVIQTDGIFS